MSKTSRISRKTLVIGVITLCLGFTLVRAHADTRVVFEKKCPSDGESEAVHMLLWPLIGFAILVADEVTEIVVRDIAEGLVAGVNHIWNYLDSDGSGVGPVVPQVEYTKLFHKVEEARTSNSEVDIAFRCLIVVVDGGTLERGERFQAEVFVDSKFFRDSVAKRFAEDQKLAHIPSIYAEFAPDIEAEGWFGLGGNLPPKGFSLKPKSLIIDGESWDSEAIEENRVGILIGMNGLYYPTTNDEAVTYEPMAIGRTFAFWEGLKVGKKYRDTDGWNSSWHFPPLPPNETIEEAQPGKNFGEIEVSIAILRGGNLDEVGRRVNENLLEQVEKLIAAR